MHVKKIRLGILCGGRSAEHEISLISAANIVAALNPEKYDVQIIGIDKNGAWHVQDTARYLKHEKNPQQISLLDKEEMVALVAQEHCKQIVSYATKTPIELDVIFPICHGTYGEDGTLQGLLKMAQIPFVGASVLGSAIGMDKDVMKRLLKEAEIPIARFLIIHAHQKEQFNFERIKNELGLPFFIKPANLGSSIGVSKVKCAEEFACALEHAFCFDRKVIVEEFIHGREIECAVLGNENPIASLPGELIPTHEFYSYEAKYIDCNGAHFKIPAELPEKLSAHIQALAIEVFNVLCCEGMARVDFFLKSNGEILVNEINTIPGFTTISMYPRLWEASGICYSALLDRLIELAIQRFNKEKQLSVTYE
jgi:D-alanine-D-alanine ligase